MTQAMRLTVIVAVAVALGSITSVCSAQDDTPDRKFGREKMSKKLSASHAPPRAMPADAIIVLDPGLDPRGEPRPILEEYGSADDPRFKVVVRESVHIHRYYPTSPCEFQAQYFSGGPTIVCVRHPRTSEQLYISLDLARGWPKVRYDDDEIEYKYPEESFTIHFEKCGDVTTSYSRCGEVKQKYRQKAEKLKECSKDLCERLKINQFAEKLTKEGKDLAAGSQDRAGVFIGKSGELFISALNLVPGYQMLKSRGEEEAAKYRDRAVDRVARERQQAEEDFKTIR